MKHVSPLSRMGAQPEKAQDAADILGFLLDILDLGSATVEFLTALDEYKDQKAS